MLDARLNKRSIDYLELSLDLEIISIIKISLDD